MTTHRPSECPACGHDRIRRVLAPKEAAFSARSETAERWACGLCRYEWATEPRRAGIPFV